MYLTGLLGPSRGQVLLLGVPGSMWPPAFGWLNQQLSRQRQSRLCQIEADGEGWVGSQSPQIAIPGQKSKGRRESSAERANCRAAHLSKAAAVDYISTGFKF